MLPYYRIFIVNAFLILKFSYTEVLQYHKNDSLIQKITRHCKDNKNKTCIEDSPRGLAVPVTKTVTKTRPIEKCCEGYFAKRDKCLPQCSIQCENSTCTSPNECTCNPGYKPTADNHRFVTKKWFSASFDERIFRCESICRGGYKFNKDTSECESVCDTPCTNGVCTGRNVCECNFGYHHEQEEGTCVKNDCDPATPDRNECPNGKCTSNGICQCNDGFIKDHQITNASKIICKPKKSSHKCDFCQCVKLLFEQPLNVSRTCYMIVMAAVLCIIIVCAFSVFVYRRYAKRLRSYYTAGRQFRQTKFFC